MYRELPTRFKAKLKPGDTVRIAKEKEAFAKGYQIIGVEKCF